MPIPTSLECLEPRIAPASIALGTGTTNSDNITLDAADTISATLNGAAGSGKLVVTGSVTIDSAALALDFAAPPGDLDQFTLIDNDEADAITGTFSGLPEGAVFKAGGTFLKISYTGGDGNDLTLTALVPRVKITADGKTATFIDVDGDLVTAKTTAGTWTREMFGLTPRGDFINGLQVESIAVGAGFDGANITITAKRDLFGGNGFVNVKEFTAGSSAITSLTIDGDVGKLDLSSPGEVAIKSVTVHSIGQLGASNRPAGTSGAEATFGRPVNKLIVQSDVVNAQIEGARLIRRLEIGGSLLGNSGLSAHQFGTISVAHDIAGASSSPVLISGYGADVSPATGVDSAIGAISVGGRVESVRIEAGAFQGEFNADASIGKITIGGDVIASSITAGTTAGADGVLGTSDDAVFSGISARNSGALVSQISSIIIRGQVLGTPDTTLDSFAISAELIRKAAVGPVKFQLSAGPHNSDDFYFLSPTGAGPTGLQSDVVLLEVLA